MSVYSWPDLALLGIVANLSMETMLHLSMACKQHSNSAQPVPSPSPARLGWKAA
jgi:hypothetical protein